MSESIDTEAIRADTRRWWSRDGNCWVAADDEPLFLTDDPSIAAEIVADHNALLDEIERLRNDPDWCRLEAERDSLRAENERQADLIVEFRKRDETQDRIRERLTAERDAAEAKLAAILDVCDEYRGDHIVNAATVVAELDEALDAEAATDA